MKKIISFLCIAFLLSSCASTKEIKIKKIGSVENTSPIIRAEGSNTYFTKVDDSKLSGIMYMRLGWSGFPQAIQVSEGTHTLKLWRDGNPDFEYLISNVKLMKDHKYLVHYRVKPQGNNQYQIQYWVEDINSGTVVYGKSMDD